MELLPAHAITEALAKSPWTLQGNELIRVIRRNDFRAALEFVNAVGLVAEGLGHHPDIDIRWNVVTLRLSTHSLGGITDADLALARALDAIV